TGLAPNRPYWYRFISGDAASRVGRAITAPAPGAKLGRLRFAFASCSHYEYGYFSAYRHLTDEQPDLVLFLGDYIYEFTNKRRPTRALPNGPAMQLYARFAFGDLAEFSMVDGRQYRSREACYRRPNLGGGHLESAERCPELVDPTRSMLGLAQEQWLFDGLARS